MEDLEIARCGLKEAQGSDWSAEAGGNGPACDSINSTLITVKV